MQSEVLKYLAREIYAVALKKQWGSNADIDEAIRLYRLSAEMGFAGAQNNLGDLYEKGNGVEQSDIAAIYWYTRAAERGEPTAYLGLASILYKNSTDKASLQQAYKFVTLARHLLSGGNRDQAIIIQALISSNLSTHELELAHEQAVNWEPLIQEEYIQGDSPAFKPLKPD